MRTHSIVALILIVGLISGCRSTYESTQTEKRDTTIVIQPLPVDSVFTVELPRPTGILNPGCDTLTILGRYADFNFVAADKHYSLLAEYDAKSRRLRILENRPPEKIPVTIEHIYKETKIVKDSLIDRLGHWGVGASVMLGLCIVAVVVLKFKGLL